MPVSDTSEAGLERLICRTLTGSDCEPYSHISDMIIAEPNYAYGGSGWVAGNPSYYDREYCVDLFQLSTFLQDTQPEIADAVDIKNDSPTRRQFLARLQGEISKRGVIDILRNGIKHGPYDINLFYGTPSPGNETAKKLYELNRFSVTSS